MAKPPKSFEETLWETANKLRGWYLMTNFNNKVKERIIRMACDVTGYSVGNEIEYRL